MHAGERIDPGDYLWPEEQNPLRGIQANAEGVRQAPLLEFFQPTPTVDGVSAPRGSESILTIDQHRASQLAMLKPTYGFPVRRKQSMQG